MYAKQSASCIMRTRWARTWVRGSNTVARGVSHKSRCPPAKVDRNDDARVERTRKQYRRHARDEDPLTRIYLARLPEGGIAQTGRVTDIRAGIDPKAHTKDP